MRSGCQRNYVQTSMSLSNQALKRSSALSWQNANMYSTDIQFPQQSTERLPVLGCTNTNCKHVRKYANHINDPCNKLLRMKAIFSCEAIHASIPRNLGGNRMCGRVFCPGWTRIKCKNLTPAFYATSRKSGRSNVGGWCANCFYYAISKKINI